MEALRNLGSSESVISILVVLLIISLFVNLFFINSRLMNKLGARKLAKKMPSEIQSYLNTQADKTSNHHKFHYIPQLFEFVVKFRSAYLRIEGKAIDRGIDSEEYWNLLNAKINDLVKVASTYIGNRPLVNIKKKIELIKSLVSESKGVENKKKIVDCLDKFYKVCDMNSSEKKIADYDRKLNKIILRFTDKYYAKMDRLVQLNTDFVEKGRSAIQTLEESTNTFDDIARKISGVNEPTQEYLDKCRDNSQQIREGVENVRNSLYELEQKVYSTRDSEGAGSEHAKQKSGELADLSEMIQAENEREISRLRKIIDSQKDTIGELEKKLDVMLVELQTTGTDGGALGEISEVEKQRNIALIESLKRNLRDAEACIKILETEVDKLRDQSAIVDADFEKVADKERLPMGESEVQSLGSVIDDLRLEVESKSLENDLLKVVAHFAVELFKGETFEDLALLLYETLGEMKVNVILKIYSPSRTFEVCASGKIPQRLGTVIDNLHLNETSNSQGSFFFKYKNFGGAVHPKEAGKLSNTEIAHVLMVIAVANKAFDRIRLLIVNKAQNQKLGECENNVKKTFSEVDAAFDKIGKNAVKVIEDSFRQLREIGKSSGLSASQIARISRLESTAVEEINSEKVTRLKVKKSFLEALSGLESIRS